MLLGEADGLLALFRRHLFPDHFGVLPKGTVSGVGAQGEREEAIRGRQIAIDAMSGGVECAHSDHGFGIGLIGSGPYIMQPTLAILRDTAAVKILLPERDLVGRFGGGFRRRLRNGLGFNVRRRFCGCRRFRRFFCIGAGGSP